MTANQWVLHASPLIALCRINLDQLFSELADQVIVPTAVVAEIDQGPPNDAARLFLATGRLSVLATPNPPSHLATWDLGAGETAVLAYCLANPGWTAVLDDRAARRFASVYQVTIIGTLGIILLARRRGLVSSAGTVIRRLQQSGFRIDDRIVREALKTIVNEDWA